MGLGTGLSGGSMEECKYLDESFFFGRGDYNCLVIAPSQALFNGYC